MQKFLKWLLLFVAAFALFFLTRGFVTSLGAARNGNVSVLVVVFVKLA